MASVIGGRSQEHSALALDVRCRFLKRFAMTSWTEAPSQERLSMPSWIKVRSQERLSMPS